MERRTIIYMVDNLDVSELIWHVTFKIYNLKFNIHRRLYDLDQAKHFQPRSL